MADAGVENVNAQVDELITTGVLRRVLAFTELKFSNSMIEAWWCSLKHQWLFLSLVSQRHHGPAISRALRPGTQPAASPFGVSRDKRRTKSVLSVSVHSGCLRGPAWRDGTGVAPPWNMVFSDSSATRSTVGAVILLALFAIGCGSSTTTTSPISPTNPEGTNPPNLLTVTIKNGVYSPNPVMVKVGQTVNWLNSDMVAHSATDSGVFDTGSIAPTSAHSDNGDGVTFNTVGTYNYHCTLHANETATIIVTP